MTDWLNHLEDITVLDRRDTRVIAKYSEVLGYIQNSPLYLDRALRAWSEATVADPWLIAAASVFEYKIVTFEKEQGSISPQNPSGKPKIPNIAKEFGVECVDLYYFMRKMNFRLQ